MDDRLTELEIRLSMMEDMVDELNRTVFRQQERIDLLQEQLRLVYRQIQAGSTSSDAPEPRNLRDEIPPHY